jgi:integrase
MESGDVQVQLSDEFLQGVAERLAVKLSVPTIKETITFGELFSLYFERHVKVRTKNSRNNAHYFFKAHGPRWKDIQVHKIIRRDVQAWVDELGAKSQSSATRAVNMLSAIINWGLRRDLVPTMQNPCQGVERFDVASRERFLALDEISRLKAALTHEPDLLRDFFWISLLTGARKDNVLTMEWVEIDFQLATWTIPAEKFKNGSSHTVPLPPPAVSILSQRYLSRSDSPWVFPSRGKSGHLADPKRPWRRVLKRAQIANCRIHDLRRTVGSWMAINGASPFTIAKMLGHRDLRSTAVYARLDLDAVRAAANKVTDGWQQVVALPQRHASAPRRMTAASAQRTMLEARVLSIVRSGSKTAKHVIRQLARNGEVDPTKVNQILDDLVKRNMLCKKYGADGGDTGRCSKWRYSRVQDSLEEIGT